MKRILARFFLSILVCFALTGCWLLFAEAYPKIVLCITLVLVMLILVIDSDTYERK